MSRSFIYVGNAASNDISVFRLGDGGLAELVQTVPFEGVEAPGGSTPLAIAPNRRFLYAGIRSQPTTVITFAIEAGNGRLRQIGTAPLADSMAYLATDRTGRFLLAASYGGSRVSVNPIGADGVAGAPAQVLDTGLNAHAILPSPDNSFVFATNLGSDQVVAFRFDATSGQLVPADPPAIALDPKSGPRHFVFSSDGRFVFLLNELDGQLIAFAYAPDAGTWHRRGSASILPENFSGKIWGAELRSTPDGRFIYASERTSSTLKCIRFDAATGELSAGESFATETQPRGFAIDPAGRFLAAVGEISDRMTIHAIDAETGALTPVSSHPTGRQPNWVEVVSL